MSDLPIPTDSGYSKTDIGAAERALNGEVYHRFFYDIANHIGEQVNSGGLEPEAGRLAVVTAAQLFTASDAFYGNFGHSGKPLNGNALEDHVEKIYEGEIVPVSKPSWTTAEMGRLQVERADILLGMAGSDVQLALADANYTLTFKPNTMAGASRTLRDEDTFLEETELEAMPHLQLSNWAIGKTVASIFEGAAKSSVPPETIRVIDIGVGTGATATAVRKSVERARDGLQEETAPGFGHLTIEGTSRFQDELKAVVADTVDDSPLFDRTYDSVYPEKPDAGEINTYHGDAVDAISTGFLGGGLDRDLTIVVANYAFHRIPSKQKSIMLHEIARLRNAVLIIGDLERNGSDVNRGYFNLAPNGPLNAGNIGLGDMIAQAGFKGVDLRRDRPVHLQPEIANKLVSPIQDKVFHVAYKGANAEEAVLAGTVQPS